MIQYGHAHISDRQKIFELWSECFADEPEFINRFLDTFFCSEQCYTAKAGNDLAGMLFMLPYRLKNGGETLSAAYLYAAATAKEQRGKGIFSALHAYAETDLRANGTDCIITVPETESLYSFYAKFGYKARLRRTVRRSAAQSAKGYGSYLRGLDKNDHTVVMDKKSFELTLDGRIFTGEGFLQNGRLYGADLSVKARTELSGMMLDLSGRCRGDYGLSFLLN